MQNIMVQNIASARLSFLYRLVQNQISVSSYIPIIHMISMHEAAITFCVIMVWNGEFVLSDK